MKTNKYIIFILALAAVFANKTSYASQVDKENTRIPIFNNQNYSLSSKDSFDEIQSIKESLLNLIEEIKTSSDYINSNEEIKLLYDNAINFNSRSLETNNFEWISFSYNNFKEDIDIIEKLANGGSADKEDINQDSLFFNNPKYKIPYLKLNKEKQDILDELIKNNNEENLLSISNLTDSNNEYIIIFFSDWLYPFIDDKDKDGVITNSKALLDSIKADKDLFESYRNTNFDLRNILEDNPLNNNNTRMENLTLMNLLTISAKTNILDDENLEISNDNKTSETVLVPETVILGKNNPIDTPDNDASNVISLNVDKTNEFKSSNSEYDEENDLINTSKDDGSIFSTHKKTKEAYAKLSDEQKQILNEMNTDGKYPLTIAEVKNSGLFQIPVKSTEWIYPFMIDKNNSREDHFVNTSNYDGSIFATHEKTKDAYAKLSDWQKQKLNEMNTDGKYPLTLDEVSKSGEFTIPVSSDVWIYPFMIDRNNSGEVGERYGQFDNAENGEPSNASPDTTNNDIVTDTPELITSNEISTSAEPVNNNTITHFTETVDNNEVSTPIESVYNNTITNSPEIHQITEPVTSSNSIISNQNVKTGIKGLKSIIIILIMAILAYCSSKKYSKISSNKK